MTRCDFWICRLRILFDQASYLTIAGVDWNVKKNSNKTICGTAEADPYYQANCLNRRVARPPHYRNVYGDVIESVVCGQNGYDDTSRIWRHRKLLIARPNSVAFERSTLPRQHLGSHRASNLNHATITSKIDTFPNMCIAV